MNVWFDQFLIKLFFALGDILVSKGKVKIDKWNEYRKAHEKSEKYEKIVQNPNSSLEDKLKAEDELGR